MLRVGERGVKLLGTAAQILFFYEPSLNYHIKYYIYLELLGPMAPLF